MTAQLKFRSACLIWHIMLHALHAKKKCNSQWFQHWQWHWCTASMFQSSKTSKYISEVTNTSCHMQAWKCKDIDKILLAITQEQWNQQNPCIKHIAMQVRTFSGTLADHESLTIIKNNYSKDWILKLNNEYSTVHLLQSFNCLVGSALQSRIQNAEHSISSAKAKPDPLQLTCLIEFDHDLPNTEIIVSSHLALQQSPSWIMPLETFMLYILYILMIHDIQETS